MARCVAFLRAINVGGRTVTMDRLTAVFDSLRFTDVETFIASGNVIFSTRASNAPALERKIERALEAELGYEVHTFLRTGDELAAIQAYRPFPAADIARAHAMSVGMLAAPPGAEASRALLRLRGTGDDFHVAGREIYWLHKVRQNESKLSNTQLEKLLGTRTTLRNINTVVRINAKYGFAL